MKRIIAKVITCIIVFTITVIIAGRYMNQENMDMTEEMSAATFPLIYMNPEGHQLNCLHGYAQEMNATLVRDNITPVNSDRVIDFVVEKNVVDINTITVEVRNIGDNRLIETQEIRFDNDSKYLSGRAVLKDLLEYDKEYSLVIIINAKSENAIRYYTRIIINDELEWKSKVNFAKEFHDMTFDKEKRKEIKTYLESDSSGNNSIFSYVNIHSSLEQVMWGELQVFQETEEDVTIRELGSNVAVIQMDYIVSMPGVVNKDYYTVNEYVKVRQGKERFYLLDFERYTNIIFKTDKNVVSNKKIQLGITDDNIQIVESDGGSIVAFVSSNRLYSYNSGDNSLASVFGFYYGSHLDKQALYNQHGVKVLSLDEMGNIYFMTYGYMNRGRREGQSGLGIYYYNYGTNSIEEQMFIKDNRSFDLIREDVEQLSFLDGRRNLYLFLNQSIVSINIESGNSKIITENLKEDAYQVSDDNTMLVWKEGNLKEKNPLNLMNLVTKKSTVVGEETGDIVIPLGFMQDDLVCGFASESEVERSTDDQMCMYKVMLENSEGDVLMEYQKPNTYITDARMQDNQITLTRISADSKIRLSDDQIVSSKIKEKSLAEIQLNNDGEKEKVVELVLPAGSDKENVKNSTPKFKITERVDVEALGNVEPNDTMYYVYNMRSVEEIHTDAASAVLHASEKSNVVVDGYGHYIWKPGENLVKNQIMKITGELMDQSRSSMAVCLDRMMSFEGVLRNSQEELDKGRQPLEILQESLADKEVLDLSGCPVKSVLYYISNEKPVLAITGKSSAVLVIGYNDSNTVIMNPENGEVYKMGLQDSDRYFSQFGNRFITCLN